ncbi:MAG: hypothetical protein IKY04_08310 [Lachnospiraceae bacterium]|nr:hypothetical protein [Lachnospiraceae bacterium]MBR4994237.1 hypothetical protein [Lachnospiraceae bacterium]MBR5944494.1 hypothetical protein [Lachnospiraceae bacterium]
MINEERVILMTRMASYEAGEGKKNIKIGDYFRADYLSKQLLKSLVFSTISFVLGLALYVFYSFENLLENVYKLDLLAEGKKLLTGYIALVVAYGLITYIVYAFRYRNARKNLKTYYGNLKKLSNMYQEENQ